MRRDIVSVLFFPPQKDCFCSRVACSLVNLEPGDTPGTESMFVEREEKKYKLSRERGRGAERTDCFRVCNAAALSPFRMMIFSVSLASGSLI